MSLLREGKNIDPSVMLGGLGILLWLDAYHIYGPRIWMLYKDVCKQDLVKMVASVRACQMGLFPIGKLQYAIDNYGKGVDPIELHTMVKTRLPKFADLITIVTEQ